MKWESWHIKGYRTLKDLLLSADILAHYGGAVLAQRDKEGRYAPRTPGKSKRNYAQPGKEGLAIVLEVKHFHQYVAGRTAVIHTGHKPLLGILNSDRQMPLILPPRMLRWSLHLQNYGYKLDYRPGRLH